MIQQVIDDLSTYSKEDLLLLARYYKLNTNIDHEKLIEKVAAKISEQIKPGGVTWNEYCKTNYIPNVIENTRLQLLKEISAGRGVCDLIKDLPRVGKSSTAAKVYDYSPTSTTRAVIKIVPATRAIEKDLNLSQLLSGESMFPYVFMTGRCGSNNYIVMEQLGPTLGDLINQRVSTSTIKKVIRGVLDAIEIMHSYGITHTDLNPDNIMLRCTGTTSYQTVIIDFDLVNNPARDIEKYTLFDVYDFMRRLHDLSELEALYPSVHTQVTDIYLKLRDHDKELTKIKRASTFKKMFE